MDRRSIFLALFIFILMAFAFYFTFQDLPTVPTEPAVEEENRAEEELEEVRFTVYNDQENQRLELASERVDNFKSEQRLELEPVRAEVYSTETGELLYTLDGDSGNYYTAREYLEIRGNVVIDSERYHILADELDYYMQRNYLEGRGSAQITGEDFISRAESFSSDLNLRDLKLSKNDSPKRAKIDFDQLTEEPKAEGSNDE